MLKRGVVLIGLSILFTVHGQGNIEAPESDSVSTGDASHAERPLNDEKSPWYSPAFLRGWTVSAGPSFKELSLNYTRPGEDTYAGSMTEGAYTTYFIRVGTPYRLSDKKRWGWNMEWDYSDFEMTKQDVDGEEKILGTSVSGYSWFVAPMGFVLFGPPPEGDAQLSFIGGLWVGLGYIKAHGDMILTEDGSNEYLVVDQEGFGIAAGVLAELHYWNLMSRLKFGGSVLGDDRAAYDAFQISLDIGYKIQF